VVLLAYAPQASEESVVEAVHAALASVARDDGKPDPAIVAALSDPAGARRLAAAVALVKAAAKDQYPPIRKLLHDPEPKVRLGVALALARSQDRAAVPILIDLVAELPADQVWRVEEILFTLAGDEVPNILAGQEKKDREKKREAWLAWWRTKGDKVDLALLNRAPLYLGFTLVVLQDNTALKGRVLELDREGKTRWQIEDLRRPVDAQLLPGDRVLIAETQTRSVTERNLKGEILWQHMAAGILVGAQRMPNGNTFIVCRNQVYEVNRGGQSVFTCQRPSSSIMGARKLANGEIVMLTSPGTWVRLDGSGKEIATCPVARTVVTYGGGFSPLPGGGILVPSYIENQVIEYGPRGDQVWKATVSRPTSVVPLPGGHVLVSSLTERRLIELDRTGKEVWQQIMDGRPLKAYRR
jgi:hypothetical protein